MFDRSKAPVPNKSLQFKIPVVHNITLSNGVELSFVEKDNLPVVYAEIIIFSGSRFDPENKKGLSYLTSLLVDEGAAEYNALQLSDEFEKLGAVFSISSNHDTTILSVLTLKEHFHRSLELVSKILFEPHFGESDFAREKKKTLDKILQLKDEPSFIASSAFEKQVFAGTFYESPEIGYEQSVDLISNDDVKNYYTNYFLEANSKIVVVGNLSQNEVNESFNKYIGKWRVPSGKKESFVQPKSTNANFYFVDKKDSAQSEIRIGHTAKKRNAEDYVPARIMNTILGGQFSSRINLNLRERKGFTYGAGSAFHYYRNSAMFQISTAVNIENTGEAIKEILKELDGIQKNISAGEVEFAKSYLIKQFPSRFETYPQIAKNLESLIIHSLPFDELNRYTEKIESATGEEIQRASMENIRLDSLTILAVGDKKKILPQLKEISGTTPTELDVNGNPTG